MKIPKKVLIEGQSWSVVRKWRIVEGGVECDGLCVPEKKEIWLCHGLDKDEAYQIFMHEFLHAVLNEKGIYLVNVSDEVEDIIVHGIAKELFNNFKISNKTQRSK
jgi:hypothetical protein